MNFTIQLFDEKLIAEKAMNADFEGSPQFDDLLQFGEDKYRIAGRIWTKHPKKKSNILVLQAVKIPKPAQEIPAPEIQQETQPEAEIQQGPKLVTDQPE